MTCESYLLQQSCCYNFAYKTFYDNKKCYTFIDVSYPSCIIKTIQRTTNKLKAVFNQHKREHLFDMNHLLCLYCYDEKTTGISLYHISIQREVYLDVSSIFIQHLSFRIPFMQINIYHNQGRFSIYNVYGLKKIYRGENHNHLNDNETLYHFLPR